MTLKVAAESESEDRDLRPEMISLLVEQQGLLRSQQSQIAGLGEALADIADGVEGLRVESQTTASDVANMRRDFNLYKAQAETARLEDKLAAEKRNAEQDKRLFGVQTAQVKLVLSLIAASGTGAGLATAAASLLGG